MSEGPLRGIRIVEMVGIGPAPFAAMILADMGAEVIRIDRPTPSGNGIARAPRFDLVARGRRTVTLDLKHPEGVACALELIAAADGLVEGFRPGVMERLGLGPDACRARNPRLVYGRLTGWGQDGLLAHAAGHDLNYLALTGVLDMIGREGQPPVPPLNLVADYAGGSLMLVAGLLAALLDAQRSGQGQVVDAAMVDGVALLATAMTGLRAAGLHDGPRGTNILDGGAPYYDVYACADGKFLSVAPIERKFREIFLRGLGFDPADFPDMDDRAMWPEARRLIAARLAQRSRDEWCAVFDRQDACVAPVLSLAEAPDHPHNAARRTHVRIDGIMQPAPAPRFGRTQVPLPAAPEDDPGTDGATILRDWGIDPDRIGTLIENGALGARQ
ncbi:alpha-methylacyl-CoA racemase [Paracoccus solventivorans]|uniref:Alpha-methylacyl-CoA racemase n=1 Tax=Paracoccus solventivorans TaxID=53463 RepID=A0A1M7ES59_9RHOB|nr:CaiB/BaiF CoA-transferase family protein [Paracoccus solventivorans]SHL94416.1 alpha-methylacyl-CoA racemase [Paracoccus solventivorans]